MPFKPLARLILLAVCVTLLGTTAAFAQARGATAKPATAKPAATGVAADEWLSLCGRCASPKVTAASGIGTANARAEARFSSKAVVISDDGPCNAGDNACVQKELTRVYRASADCTAGRITTIQEESYTLAGLWDNSDIGGGRTRWKGGDGQVVGRDNASSGLSISQQWEVLCPGPVTPALLARAAQARPAAAAPAQQSLCAGQRYCEEVGSFVATVTDFRLSMYQTTMRVVSLTIRIQNKSDRNLILAYVPQSAVAIDEQGNRFTIASANNIRGIGELSNSFDPKFNLGPGQSGDIRLEPTWRIDSRAILGQRSWDFDVSLREVNEVGPGQYRFGTEHALQFKGLQPAGQSTAAPAAAPGAPLPAVPAGAGTARGTVPSTPPPAAPVAALPQGDGCAGRQRCYDAGLFIAEIANASSSFVNRSGRWHVVALNVRFTNRTNEPINLGYMVGSAVMLDNFGNRYVISAAPDDVKGMGKVTGAAADPQFVLRPGESRAATFGQARITQANQPIGTAYAFDVSIAHLQVLYNGQQVRTVREYTMTFPDFGLNAPGAATSSVPNPQTIKGATDAIRGIFGGGQKK